MTDPLANRIGFWSASLATLALATFAVASVVTIVAFPEAVVWRGIEAYAASYNPTLMFVLMFPCFVLAPSMLVMMTCLHHLAPQDRKILSLLALVFTIVYAAQITYNYYTQLAAIGPSLMSGQTQGLAIHAFFNPNSIPLNLELLGYGMLSVGMIFAAFLFHGSKADTAIRWLFLVNGVLNAIYVFDPFLHIGGPPIVLLLFNWTVPIATALIAVRLRRMVA